MFEVLNSYLFQHKSISIPGLGTIFLERAPANSDAGNRHFLPPLYHFRFDKYSDAPDKDFFAFIAAEKNMPDYEAIKWYSEFSHDLRNRIRQEESVQWDEVGILKKDFAGNVIFEPVPEDPALLTPVAANPVIRKDGQYSILSGDKEITGYQIPQWQEENIPAPNSIRWIYAIIVAAMLALVLLLHFYKNGWQASSLGNQQKLEVNK